MNFREASRYVVKALDNIPKKNEIVVDFMELLVLSSLSSLMQALRSD
jgi:hypothetical protein